MRLREDGRLEPFPEPADRREKASLAFQVDSWPVRLPVFDPQDLLKLADRARQHHANRDIGFAKALGDLP
jgi:hypothetical protein